MRSLFAKKRRFRIGVAGYSTKYFDKDKARELLEKAIKTALKANKDDLEVSIVSGLTDIGIPGLAYEIAEEKGYHTVGFACPKAEEFDCFDVDEKHIIGKDWGDESEEFLSNIDAFIRIGGGKQSLREAQQAEKMGLKVVEHELVAMKSLCLMGYLDEADAKLLQKELGKIKAEEVHEPDDYHVTIRYWQMNEDVFDAHFKKVVKYFEERFQYPVGFEIEFDGTHDVWGEEQSYVLKVAPGLLNSFQAEIDKELQKLGAPPSTFPDYKPHITIGQKVEGKPKPPKIKLTISHWKLALKTDCGTDHEIAWKSEKMIKTASRKVIASFDQLATVTNADDVLDFLVFRCPMKVVNSAAFDRLLMQFFATLPDFDSRNDFSEQEIEAFKQTFPYQEFDLDRHETLQLIKNYRSINRVLDQIVECLSEAKKKEIARDHLKQFWLEKMFNGDMQKFVKALKKQFFTEEE